MQRNMLRGAVYCALLTGLTAALAGCGGGGSDASSGGSSPPSATMAEVPLLLSDASSDDWACVGVRVLSIALIPQGGGDATVVWSAPAQPPYVNLVQLDQLAELLGNVSVPLGSYSGAIVTIAANPGDVLLTTAANPPSGFPLAGGTSIASGQIQIQGAQGAAGNLTVALTVNFAAALNVTATGSNALDLEFDLGNPAFIVGHTPPAADGATLWAVNFKGPVRHLPVHDLTRLVLRHTYGTVTAVSSGSLTITKDFPTLPASNPETAVASTQALSILADSVNGTIVYDLDQGTRTVVSNFSSEAGLDAKYVRIAARYQQDGSLVAVRVWASSEFGKVWLSPEGHVLNVNTSTNIVTVTDENGQAVPVQVNDQTQFFFRTPASALADATPISTGTAMLANGQLVRGFKVHVASMDALAAPIVADEIDIETAAYGGHVSNVSTAGFTYTSDYVLQNDNYAVTLSYIADTTANGFDDDGDPINGFKWWDFTFPTAVTFGTDATADFVAATSGAVNFGGTVGALAPWGVSATRWGDGGSNASGWYLRDAVLVPTPVPLGSVTAALANNSFAMTVVGGTLPVAVDVSTTSGSATLVYQVNRSGGIVTISPLDITNGGLNTLMQGLTPGALVKVYGVPEAPVPPATTGTLRAYVLLYYSGMMPSM